MVRKIALCSACLLGINCRYDGKRRANRKVLRMTKKELLIPVCPEQLGGLPTPRDDSEKRGRRVFTRSGEDLTAKYTKGAREALLLARLLGAKKAILKQRSPSCGCGKIYDGTFSKVIVRGDGIAASMLKRNGIKVMSEEDL